MSISGHISGIKSGVTTGAFGSSASVVLAPLTSLTSKGIQDISSLEGFNNNEFTVVATVTDSGGFADGGNEILFSLDDGSFSNSVYSQERSTGARFRSAYQSAGLRTLVDLFGNVLPQGTNKIAHTCDSAGNYHMTINGAVVAQEATGVTPATVTTLRNGEGATGGNDYTQGTLNPVDLYNAQSQSITAKLTRDVQIVSGSTAQGADVFAVTGQSNAGGKGSGTHSAFTNTPKLVGLDGVYKDFTDSDYNSFTGALITGFNDGTSYGSSYAGLIADAVMTAQGNTVAMSPAFRGTTDMSVWGTRVSLGTITNNDSNVTHWGSQAISAHCQALIAQQYGTLKAEIHHQGELSAQNGGSEVTTFAADKLNYITDRRTALGSNLPFIIVTLHQWNAAISATEANWNAIIAAQQSLSDPANGIYVVDISDLPGNTSDRIHLDTTEQVTVASRIATVINTNLY